MKGGGACVGCLQPLLSLLFLDSGGFLWSSGETPCCLFQPRSQQPPWTATFKHTSFPIRGEARTTRADSRGESPGLEAKYGPAPTPRLETTGAGRVAGRSSASTRPPTAGCGSGSGPQGRHPCLQRLVPGEAAALTFSSAALSCRGSSVSGRVLSALCCASNLHRRCYLGALNQVCSLLRLPGGRSLVDCQDGLFQSREEEATARLKRARSHGNASQQTER